MPPPRQKPNRSRQNYWTPRDFVRAAQFKLGIKAFAFDFAADSRNRVCPAYYSRRDDALARDGAAWAANLGPDDWGWLNPEFGDIEPYAERCAQVRAAQRQIAFLVPASVGANWYRDFVHRHAFVLALNGRLAFMPSRPTWLYPKDCVLALYSPQLSAGFDVWTWRETLAAAKAAA